MGCANSRKEEFLNDISSKCEHLMQENINRLSIIMYLFVKSKNTGCALVVMNIQKRTEDFYKTISKFRHYWMIKARRMYEKTLKYQIISDSQIENLKEKEQLLIAKNKLDTIIESLLPEWKSKFRKLEKLKENLENDEVLMNYIGDLYFNYYSCEKQDILFYIRENNLEISEENNKILKKIKEVTVKFQKTSSVRLYSCNTSVITSNIEEPVIYSSTKELTSEKIANASSESIDENFYERDREKLPDIMIEKSSQEFFEEVSEESFNEEVRYSISQK